MGKLGLVMRDSAAGAILQPVEFCFVSSNNLFSSYLDNESFGVEQPHVSECLRLCQSLRHEGVDNKTGDPDGSLFIHQFMKLDD